MTKVFVSGVKLETGGETGGEEEETAGAGLFTKETEGKEVNQILGDDVIPVVLTALVPNVIDAFIIGDTAAVIDGLQFDWLPRS